MFVIFILLPLFFMYVFPAFFIDIPVTRTTPIFATVLLGLGLIFWLIETFMISKFISGPRKMAKKHRKVQENGKFVRAKILASDDQAYLDENLEKKILIEFPNLVGNKVKSYISLLDSKEKEKRFEPGKEIGLRLNINGFEPAFAFSEGEYGTFKGPWAWAWVIFNLLYMVGFFLISYKIQSDGYGWRFLNPSSPWIWAPLAGIVIINFIQKLLGSQDIVEEYYEIKSFKNEKEFGELLLYGQKSQGEIKKFSQTGVYINEQPQIRFTVNFSTEKEGPVTKTFKQIIPLTELHQLKNGPVEIIYLERDSGVFMGEYIE